MTTPEKSDGDTPVISISSSTQVRSSLPSDYQTFIALSRYARYREDLGRRETWDETVSRYFNFFDEHLKEKHEKAYPAYQEIRPKLEKAVLNLEVMPSMRGLMTAGKALSRDETCLFNCSFIAVDTPRAFDEAMYVAMCGTGVGFSVESVHVSKLPIVSEEFQDTDTTISVPDSKMGWAVSFRELIAMLYAGRVPKWDLSKLRPAGAKLKTMGGRSSGPEPLNSLFRFAVATFRNAAGRKLTSIEAHDLICKVADIVVVGGVRRSSLISLSDLGDEQMRKAKSGKWWETSPQRALANNSASYKGKPDMQTFMKEWFALVESKSGERGIFNLNAAQEHASSNGRRDGKQVMGTNPCCVLGDTILMTTTGPQRIDELEGIPFIAVVNGMEYPAPRGSWKSGETDVYKLHTQAGYELVLTKDHMVKTSRGWIEVGKLNESDRIGINRDCRWHSWEGRGAYEEGYLLGMLIGDGNFMNPRKESMAELKTWKKDIGSDAMRVESVEYAKSLKHRSDWAGWNELKLYYRMCIGRDLPNNFGIYWGHKVVTQEVELASSDFQRAFLKGYFDTDGHVEGTQQKSFSIRLGGVDLENLKAVQRMLLRFGIASRIHLLKEATKRMMPDGHDNLKLYQCQKSYRLIVSANSIKKFEETIGFTHAIKKEKLKNISSSIRFYDKPFSTKFVGLEYIGVHEVWDAEVSEVHAFDANGIIAHNSEILLRQNETCNLSEVVVRNGDTTKVLKEKIRLATILGTLQSTFTNFRYVRKNWKTNAEEERLLGVSLTGIMDHEVLSKNSDTLPRLLRDLKDVAIETNKEWSKILEINQSAAITCCKPSGTVSQLVDSASGIHARHSRFYIRTVRADKKDPLARMMVDIGFPHADDVTKPDYTTVFSFPMKSPEHAVMRNDMTAVQQLEVWKTYAQNWCEHKPSCTISVREHEWLEVGAWVYKNFDIMSGISFLPFTDHIYAQSPYSEINESQYNELLAKMPKNVDWQTLKAYESEDNTVGSQTSGCSGSSCEIVDLV